MSRAFVYFAAPLCSTHNLYFFIALHAYPYVNANVLVLALFSWKSLHKVVCLAVSKFDTVLFAFVRYSLSAYPSATYFSFFAKAFSTFFFYSTVPTSTL